MDAFDADEQVVLLIDEIDKADIEFPNDLLLELDRMEFFVYETQEQVQAKTRLVIITSNNENCPTRSCGVAFHYIKFPEPETMEQIVQVHFPDLKKLLLRQALSALPKSATCRG